MNGLGSVAIALAVGIVVGLLVAVVVAVVLFRRGAWLRTTGQNAPDAVSEVLVDIGRPMLIIGADFHVAAASPEARALGLVAADEIVPNSLRDFVHDALTADEATVRDLVLDGHANGSDVRLSARASRLPDSRLLVQVDDTSARDRLSAVRSDFLANVSHELKTPVAAIALLGEALSEAADDPEQVRRFTESLTGEAARMARLVQDVIELSRIESGERNLVATSFTIGDAIDEALTKNRLVAEAQSIELAVLGQTEITISGDKHMISTAVSNLIENAIQYSRPHGHVAVRVDSADANVHVSVEDDGIGIAPHDIERIFERFYRADESRAQRGTGLGLSIVKHTAQVHSGSVSVTSQPGKGSVFTLELPRAAVGIVAGGRKE